MSTTLKTLPDNAEGREGEEDANCPSSQKDLSQEKRFYGRRKGHALSQRQNRLVHTLLPEISPSAKKPVSVTSLFPRKSDISLEIGFGGAEHLLRQAQNHPDRFFLGVEPYINGVAKALVGIEEGKLQNVRLYHGDVHDILPGIETGWLQRIFILFPDPWPKKRHAKRRLLQPAFIRELARLLAPGGELFFATDSRVLTDWALPHLLKEKNLDWAVRRARDWRSPPQGWLPTRYEEKALQAGRPCAYCHFFRLG